MTNRPFSFVHKQYTLGRQGLTELGGEIYYLTITSNTSFLGVATESSYCAVNAFLDAFAHWRRAISRLHPR